MKVNDRKTQWVKPYVVQIEFLSPLLYQRLTIHKEGHLL